MDRRFEEAELDAATKVRAATILAIGYFIADAPGATTYAEAVQRRDMTFDQATEEIIANVARAYVSYDLR
jgi:hypothetical protein